MSEPAPEDVVDNADDVTLDDDCDPTLTDALDHDTDLDGDDDGKGV